MSAPDSVLLNSDGSLYFQGRAICNLASQSYAAVYDSILGLKPKSIKFQAVLVCKDWYDKATTEALRFAVERSNNFSMYPDEDAPMDIYRIAVFHNNGEYYKKQHMKFPKLTFSTCFQIKKFTDEFVDKMLLRCFVE